MPILLTPFVARFLQAGPVACLLSVVLLTRSLPVLAAEWHVATNGSPNGSGTQSAPWDIAAALDGSHQVLPGDTLWIHQGHYKCAPKVGGMGYVVRLVGRDAAPVQVRAWQGRRVTIDGGLNVQPPSTYLWIWDFEILVSEPRPSALVPPDPTYANVNRPWGGLNVYSGRGCKFINLVIHDNTQGVSWWVASQDSEMHGCVIYDNGWAGTDRGHGHAIYTQNNEGLKTISDCIFAGGYGYTLHAYGSSRADVNNYRVEGNIAYDAHTFLIGGGKPSHGIQVLTNCFCRVPVQLGYDAPTNRDCEVRGNLIVDSGLTINRFERVVSEDNLILGNNDPRPGAMRVFLRVNKYDPRRANLAICNWERESSVVVNVSPLLKPGDEFRLLNPRDFFGPPILTGRATGPSIKVPMHGEFSAFVLLKE
jgi:Right handed beta helix region